MFVMFISISGAACDAFSEQDIRLSPSDVNDSSTIKQEWNHVEEHTKQDAQQKRFPFTCDASLSVYSKYVFRGFEQSKNSVVFFPSFTLGYGGFEVNVWGYYDTDYEGTGDSEWWETDYTLSYGSSFGLFGDAIVDWSAGWAYYDIDGGDDEELFLVFGIRGLNEWVKPEISIWRAIQHGDTSWYYAFSLQRCFEPWRTMSFTLGATAGYYYLQNGDSDGSNYKAWHDGNLRAEIELPVTRWCTITPAVQYSFPLSSDAKDVIKSASFDGNDSDWVYGGVVVTISF